MTGRVVGHYRILDQIGAGGMGTVYRAEDQRLGRQVALKFLPGDLDQVSGALDRFRREAEVVSSLNHPNVCTLYDVGDDNGRQFLVLELVDGRVLKDVLRAGAMPVERAIALVIELADALDAAHSRGIVHRDIKPANIMVTSRGSAKLMDFGIATLAASDTPGSQAATAAQITAPGTWVGTPEYMAPEQARGEPADTRSDLFALGAVLFEMVTGRVAFGARSPTMAIDAVLNRTPPAPSTLNPSVPDELSRVAAKALEKDPNYRYQTAKELLTDLRRLARDTGSSRAGATPRSLRRSRGVTLLAAAGAVGLIVGVAWWYWSAARATPTGEFGAPAATATQARLVVLPFENLTRRPDDDWLAGAFSDSVSAGLQPIESLILVPRERVVELYDAEGRRESATLTTDLAQQISQKLRVRYYVHGSYQRVGDDVRVVARLVDVAEDAIRAQETLTGRFADVLALQDTLAGRVADRLNVTGGLSTAGSGAAPSLRTLQLVSEARAAYALSRLNEAAALLQTATKEDPKYGPAWALLAKANARLLAPAAATGQPSTQQYREVLEQAQTAATLSPDTVDSFVAMALGYRGLLDRTRMREMAQRAVALDPRNGEARVILGDAFSISPGFGCPTSPQPEAAEQAYLEALRIDPFFGSGYVNLVTLRWWMARRVEAMEALEDGLAAQPRNALLHVTRPFNLLFAGRVEESERLMRQRVDAGAVLTPLEDVTVGYLALKKGQWAEADARFAGPATAHALNNLALNLITSVAYFEAGRPAEGASYLARGVAKEPDCVAWARLVPALAPYRDTPEFAAALKLSR